MRKRSKSVAIKAGTLIVILIIVTYIAAVYRYGNFNIFGSPHRLAISGFDFHNDNDIKTLTGNEKPTCEISGIIDRLTGKRIYSMEKDFKAGNGKRIFLHIKADEYIMLQCGGGA